MTNILFTLITMGWRLSCYKASDLRIIFIINLSLEQKIMREALRSLSP